MRSRHLAATALVLLASLSCTGTAWSHHSASAYDLSGVVTREGTLTVFRFENPHVHFLLDVKGADGKTTTWDIEGAPPNWFRHAGISRADLEKGVGHVVKIEMHAARDGGPTGFFQKITFEDGTFVRFGDVVQP